MTFAGLSISEWMAVGTVVFAAVAAFLNIKSTVAANSRAIEEMAASIKPAMADLKREIKDELKRIETDNARRFNAVELNAAKTGIELDGLRDRMEGHRVEIAEKYVKQDDHRASQATVLSEIKSLGVRLDGTLDKIWRKQESNGSR